MSVKNLLMAVGVAAAMVVTSGTASADVFSVNEVPYGVGTFQADEIHGGYEEILTITGFDGVNGTFETVAFFNVGTFELGGVDVFGSSEGSTYQLYALFSADGTFTATATGFEFTATPGAGGVELWIDPEGDTTLGLPGNGTGGIGSLVVGSNGTDVRIATAPLLSGDGDSSAGAAQGNFDLFFNPWTLTSPAGETYFYAPDPFYLNAHLEGNFDEFDPFDQNQFIDGSANAEFNERPVVPEPLTLTLFGVGLLGCGIAARRRRKV